MNYSCTSEMHRVCTNNALCHLCDGKRLFKDPVAERKAKEEAKREKQQAKKQELLKTHSKEKKEGMGFEKRVAKQWNQKVGSGRAKPAAGGKPRIQVETPEARRQPNSGAMWHSKGDIKLHHALMECKERGTTNSRGEKQITIPKEWLDKMEKEAFQEGREFWYLPFGYKGSEDIYLVKPFNHEMQLINDVREARERIEQLEERLKELGG